MGVGEGLSSDVGGYVGVGEALEKDPAVMRVVLLALERLGRTVGGVIGIGEDLAVM